MPMTAKGNEMIENLQTWMMAFDFTSWMGFGLYWLPLSLCASGTRCERGSTTKRT